MSTNLDYIKATLSREEQFLENAIRGEKFFKKHLKKFIFVAVVLVGVAIFFVVKNFVDEANLKSANEAYTTLLKEPKNAQARATLREKNANLFALFALKSGDLTAIKEALTLPTDPLLKESLTVASGTKSDAILVDYARIVDGFGYLKNGDFEKARIEFDKISPTSPLKDLANKLWHYQGLKK